MKKRNKVVRWIVGAIVVCLTVFLYTKRYRIIEVANYFFFDEYVLEELTMEEKLEDFEQFYSTIVESVPYLDEIEKWYGIDFEGRKDFYISEIQKTQDNFEFFCLMCAIVQDIPSFHTNIVEPLYWNVRNLSCHNDDETIRQLGMRSKILAWEKVIEEKVLAYEDIEMIDVYYVAGKYYPEETLLPESHLDIKDCELVSIDGVVADEYIANCFSLYKRYYDSEHDKPYRRGYTFNDSIGEMVEVVWRSADGNYIVKELYVDLGVECTASYGYLFSDKYEINGLFYEPSVSMYRDDVNELEYIKINDFMNSEGETLREYLENVQYSKIVIDLRGNCGGFANYYKEYLYPALYAQDIVYEYEFKVPDSEMNRLMTDDWLSLIGLSGEKKEGYYYYSTYSRQKGEQKEQKEIYYLVGPQTGSAADRYVNLVKDNNLGTVVGENTAGEGLGGSFICDSLNNSSIIYTYFPSIPVGEKQSNSCCGTAPDVYVQQSEEEFDLEQMYEKDGTVLEYDNRLKYDAVLKWVIEQ